MAHPFVTSSQAQVAAAHKDNEARLGVVLERQDDETRHLHAKLHAQRAAMEEVKRQEAERCVRSPSFSLFFTLVVQFGLHY